MRIVVLSDVLILHSLCCGLLAWHFKLADTKLEVDEPHLGPPTHTYTQIRSAIHYLHAVSNFSLK